MARAAGEARVMTYRRRHRLSLDRDYRAVYGARVRKSKGPLTVFGRPNGLAHARLGLSVGRRVGPAVVRNIVKRRLREAFRLSGDLPGGYDFVVNVAPHEPVGMEVYRNLLRGLASEIRREWERRSRRAEGRDGGRGDD